MTGNIRQALEGLIGDRVEAGDVPLHLGIRRAGLLCHIIHGSDEVGNSCYQRALDPAHVIVRAAEHFLQQNIGLPQALEEGGSVRPQHVLRLYDL
jgi:hypothetical protein